MGVPNNKSGDAPRVSIIVPVFNEAEVIARLVDEIQDVFVDDYAGFELILVDDGSVDRTRSILGELAAADSRIKIIEFARNYGQTAALMAGFNYAEADIVVTLDGDGQNDPAEIPKLLEKITDGNDAVYGWRRQRKDAVFSRRLPSVLANWLIGIVSGVKVHDYGCTLKAFRSPLIRRLRLYGEMHRFIPLYVEWLGGKAVEIEVNHRPRMGGRSHYGIGRVPKVLLDLVVVLFLHRYLAKPIYVFGGFGLLCIMASAVFALWAVYLKVFEGASFILTPIPLLTVTTGLMGVMSLLMGLLAEVIVRTYHEGLDKRAYVIRSTENLPEA